MIDPATAPEHILRAEVGRLTNEVATLEREVKRSENLRAFDTNVTPLPKGLMLEYGRLDSMWQQLVRERDSYRENLKVIRDKGCSCPSLVDPAEICAACIAIEALKTTQ